MLLHWAFYFVLSVYPENKYPQHQCNTNPPIHPSIPVWSRNQVVDAFVSSAVGNLTSSAKASQMALQTDRTKKVVAARPEFLAMVSNCHRSHGMNGITSIAALWFRKIRSENRCETIEGASVHSKQLTKLGWISVP